jgi:hypothetical protein
MIGACHDAITALAGACTDIVGLPLGAVTSGITDALDACISIPESMVAGVADFCVGPAGPFGFLCSAIEGLTDACIGL